MMMIRTSAMATAAFVSVALAGCDDSPTVPDPGTDPTVWVAQLEAQGDFEVTGTATFESTEDGSEVSIEIEEAAEGQEHFWYVGTGATCGEPDTMIGEAGDYPALEPNGEGVGTAEATLDQGLDAEETYHVAVLIPGEGEEEDTLVACGELTVED
jgi:Cu/Zn superoxide dismutase